MSATISARSPILQYTPCVDCVANGGWQAGQNDMEGRDGRLSVAFNFTGTAFAYDFATPPSDDWHRTLSVNGSQSSKGPYQLDSLPLGTHTVQLVLTPPQPDPFSNSSIDPFTLSSITINTGLITSSTSRNITIDDTAWRNGTVILTPGWNMMESDTNGAESNYINQTQIDQERKTRSRNYNETLSWTEQRRAETTILFEGEQVWVYGLSGGEAGGYEVLVDGVSRGRYSAAGGERVYQSLLYTANLPAGQHNLTLSNLEEGKRLSFDRLVAVSGLTPAPIPTHSPTPSPSSTSGSQELDTHGLSPGAVGGIVIGVLVGLATIIPLIVFILRQRKKRYDDDLRIEKDGSVPDTFFRWPSSSRDTSKKDTEGSWHRLPDRGLSPNPAIEPSANGGGYSSNSDAGFSLGSTTRNAADDQSRSGMGIFKLPNALRKSGTWTFGSGAPSERSFLPDLGSPSSSTHGHSQSHASRFREREKGLESPSSFFSFNHKGSKKPDFTISNPIPLTTAGSGMASRAGEEVGDDGMTPAMAAAVNGRTMSPLARIKNNALAGDVKLMPIGLGANMSPGEAGQEDRARIGTAF